jgi:hypothetical protein
MPENELEKRVAALEWQFAEILKLIRPKTTKAGWRTVVGLFADDPDIEELHYEVRRVREEDRAATRDS